MYSFNERIVPGIIAQIATICCVWLRILILVNEICIVIKTNYRNALKNFLQKRLRRYS